MYYTQLIVNHKMCNAVENTQKTISFLVIAFIYGRHYRQVIFNYKRTSKNEQKKTHSIDAQ